VIDAYCTSGNSPTEGPDFLVHADSFPATVFLLIPITDRAHEWAAEHISGDVLRLGASVSVEWRYLPDLLARIHQDGLTAERG
jgi:hypothetical protein